MEIESASLLRAVLYLGVPFVLMVFYFQYKWAKVCEKNINVLVALRSGGGEFRLAPKEGGVVSIYNKETDETRSWPVNELATIDVTYPGVGFVPKWMQKTIRLAVVNEGDMEPMLNRSPHRKKIASPDVLEFIQAIGDEIGESEDKELQRVKTLIDKFTKDLSTGPTRELIADPLTLGSLMRNAVLKALATVSNDLLEQLKLLNAKMAKVVGPNPMIVYILLGLSVCLNVYAVYSLAQITPMLEQAGQIATIASKVNSIATSLGVQ